MRRQNSSSAAILLPGSLPTMSAALMAPIEVPISQSARSPALCRATVDARLIGSERAASRRTTTICPVSGVGLRRLTASFAALIAPDVSSFDRLFMVLIRLHEVAPRGGRFADAGSKLNQQLASRIDDGRRYRDFAACGLAERSLVAKNAATMRAAPMPATQATQPKF